MSFFTRYLESTQLDTQSTTHKWKFPYKNLDCFDVRNCKYTTKNHSKSTTHPLYQASQGRGRQMYAYWDFLIIYMFQDPGRFLFKFNLRKIHNMKRNALHFPGFYFSWRAYNFHGRNTSSQSKCTGMYHQKEIRFFIYGLQLFGGLFDNQAMVILPPS